MHLTTTTDYATRIICCLAKNDGMMSAAVLSNKLDIPMSYIFKVTKLLKQADLIRSLDGQKGGYALAKEPREITLMEVILATEKTVCLMNYSEETHGVKNSINGKIREFYEELQELIHGKMSITVQELMQTISE